MKLVESDPCCDHFNWEMTERELKVLHLSYLKGPPLCFLLSEDYFSDDCAILGAIK